MLECAVILAVLISGISIGIVSMFFRELKITRASLHDKVIEFDNITRQASAANNSLADKLIEFEKRLEQVEFRQSAGAFGVKK